MVTDVDNDVDSVAQARRFPHVVTLSVTSPHYSDFFG